MKLSYSDIITFYFFIFEKLIIICDCLFAVVKIVTVELLILKYLVCNLAESHKSLLLEGFFILIIFIAFE